MSEVIAAIEKPVLLIWGADDQIAPIRVAQMLHYHLKNSHLILIPGQGHSPHRENPQSVYEPTLRWIKNPILSKITLPKTGQRKFHCKLSKVPQVLTGSYGEMVFDSCKNIVLKNLAASKITFKNTSAKLINVSIQAKEIALDLVGSNIVATNVNIAANVGIKVEESKLDMAGGIIHYQERAASGFGSIIYWSISYLQKKNEKIYPIHGRISYKNKKS